VWWQCGLLSNYFDNLLLFDAYLAAALLGNTAAPFTFSNSRLLYSCISPHNKHARPEMFSCEFSLTVNFDPT